MFQPGDPIHTPREEAREYRMKEIRRPYPIFSTYDPNWIKAWAIWGMWWIDCAPEGANHILAPLQGKDGRPCNAADNSENIGPNKALREARAKRGLNPFDPTQLARPRPPLFDSRDPNVGEECAEMFGSQLAKNLAADLRDNPIKDVEELLTNAVIVWYSDDPALD